jgi:uncharacterized protein
VVIGAIVLTLCCAPASQAPALNGRVNDFANVLAREERASLEQDLVQFEDASEAILVLVTVDSFRPFPSMSAFSSELFKNRGRGIGDGRRNNGLLFVLAVQDREARMTTGLGLEDVVTDATAAAVVQHTIADFRRLAYADGFRAGVQALRRVFEEHQRR